MHYFEESFRYFPSNIDNLIILGFLYLREEIYEKAIKYFEIAKKVQPNNHIPELQYGKCFHKLGNNREAFKVFRRLHNKYPDNKEVLNFLINISKDLNLPYEEYYQKLNRFERDSMLSDPYMQGMGGYEYGQPVEYNGYGGSQDNQMEYYQYGMPANSSYKGEEVDYSMFTKHQQQNIQPKASNNFMKYETRADELLP